MQLSGREIPGTQPVHALGTNSRDDCVRVGASTSPCWAQMAGVEAGGCRGATSCHVHTAAPNLRKTPSISPNTHPSHHPPGWDGGGQHTGHSRARLVPRWATQPGQELLTVSSIPTAQQRGAAGHGGLRARASRDSPCCHQLSFPCEVYSTWQPGWSSSRLPRESRLAARLGHLCGHMSTAIKTCGQTGHGDVLHGAWSTRRGCCIP